MPFPDFSIVFRMNPSGCGATLSRPSATSPCPKRSTGLPVCLADDNCDFVRHNAALSLAKIGPDAERALPSIEKALEDENLYVQGNTRLALARIGDSL